MSKKQDAKKKTRKRVVAHKPRRKRKKKMEYMLRAGRGKAFIQATYNNTVVTLADQQGNVITWGSAGRAGFTGPKQSTPFAAQQVVKLIANNAKDKGLTSVDAFLKGPGAGRDAAVRALNGNGIQVMSIKDVTPIPHNGVRPRKRRRV